MQMLDRLLKQSLTVKIFIGMGAGFLCGIFFGEDCRHIAIIGKIFIKLVQMPVIPYIVLSLMVGISNVSSTKTGGIFRYLICVVGSLM